MQEVGIKKTIGILIGILGLTLVIVVHEFGHYLACKIFHVHTPTFSIGFDPAIYHIKPKTTKFQIGAILLGGYVSIDPNTFARISYLKKMIIILAGILFNIIFSLLIFFYLRTKKRDKSQENKSDIFSLIREARPDEAKEAIPEKQKNGFIGPIGIISLMGRSVSLGLDVYLYFLAIISLNIAILNLLPIPFFDGGQALTITIETIRGRAFSSSFMDWLFYIFLFLFIIITIILSIKDIKKIGKK